MTPADRFLCSHLVRLAIEGSDRAPVVAVLEEIDSFGVVAAVEAPWPAAVEARIEAESFAARAYVRRCTRRETDYALELGFLDGYRWSPADWRPDHLYLPQGAPRARTAGAGG